MREKAENNISTGSIAFIVLVFCALIAIFPKDSLYAAKEGLLLWFNNVFPSLLPFIVGINLLIGMGVLEVFGKLLSPVMKPVFGVSGAGGFALVAGMLSGYPMGAKVVSGLRKDNYISKVEAQRLIGFANNSGPLFITGAVGIGMFGSASVGYFFLVTHYLSAIINGILHRLYKPGNKQHTYMKIPAKTITKQSFSALFGESVENAMETILVIGGFIIIFCVIVRLLNITGIFFALSRPLNGIADSLGLDSNSLSGILTGIIEITNGTKTISQSAVSRPTLLAAAAVISFGGFSIHAQAASFIKETDISIFMYVVSKAVHAIISVIVGFFLLPIFGL